MILYELSALTTTVVDSVGVPSVVEVHENVKEGHPDIVPVTAFCKSGNGSKFWVMSLPSPFHQIVNAMPVKTARMVWMSGPEKIFGLNSGGFWMNAASALIAPTNGPVREGKSVGNSNKLACRCFAAYVRPGSAMFVIHCTSEGVRLEPLFPSRGFWLDPSGHVSVK